MALTRGPLPSSVYWRRRLVIVTLALLLVVVIAKVLGGGSDGRSDHAAEQVAAGSHPAVTVTITPSGQDSPGQGSAPASPIPTAPRSTATTALPSPSGTCDPADVTVTPSVTNAYVGSPVTVALQLRTKTDPACTWEVSSDALQARITKGGETVWSTLDCPKAVPSTSVTVYRDAVSTLSLSWLGHVSDQTCSVHTPWATKGTYQVTATALGGEPAEAAFQMGVPGQTSGSTSGSPSGSTSGSASAGGQTGGTPSQTVTPTLTPYGSPTGTSSGAATGSPTGAPLKR